MTEILTENPAAQVVDSTDMLDAHIAEYGEAVCGGCAGLICEEDDKPIWRHGWCFHGAECLADHDEQFQSNK